MDKETIEKVLECDNYVECMKIIYKAYPVGFKEEEAPDEIKVHLKSLRKNGLDINKPIQIRKK